MKFIKYLLLLLAIPGSVLGASGAPHAFTVFNTDRYQESADKKSWKRFQGFLADTLR